jgi:hypothetical protein
MLRTLIRIQEGLRHYVAGSAYVLVHLAMHERRARALMPDAARQAPHLALRPGPATATRGREAAAGAQSANGSSAA